MRVTIATIGLLAAAVRGAGSAAHRAPEPAGPERYRDELKTFRQWTRRYRDCAGGSCPKELNPTL